MKKQIKKLIAMTCVLACASSTLSACSEALKSSTLKIDEKKTQLYVGNYDGGMGDRWLEEYKKGFEEMYKDVSFETGKKGVEVINLSDKITYDAANLKNTMDRSQVNVFFTERVDYYAYQKEGLKQEKIERELVFVTFAYVHSIAPPVKKVGNTYVPLFDFKLEKNIGVMIAPLFARGDKSYFDDENCHGRSTCHYDIYGYKMKDIFLGWRAIMDKLFVWSYCNDFCETLAPFNCWDGLEGNYRGYKDINVEYVFEEAAYNRIVPNFHYLRPYVLSKLMWNTNCSLESAIDEFIEGFYGANAAPYMRKYFDYLRDCCRKITSEKGRPMLYIRLDDFSDLTMPEYWSVDVLKEALRLHEEVVAHADEEYKARVEEEGFPIWFIMLARYHHRITDEERYEMAKRATAVMEKYDLLVRGEGIPFVYLQKIKTFVDSPYFRKVKKK